jgi:hypothetical protein
MKMFLTGLTVGLLIAAALPGCSRRQDSKQSSPTVQDAAAEPSAQDAWPSPLLRGQAAAAEDDTRAKGPAETSPPAKSGPSHERAIALGSKLGLTAPEDWVRKEPRSQIIEYEFAVPAVKDDKEGGRVTVLAAGGTIEANLERWFGQYTQPDGSPTSTKAKREDRQIAGRKVTLVDISGTFHESRGGGPFAPGPVVDLPGYRTLAAIIPTDHGNYFVRFNGPEKTVEAQAAAFRKMIEGLAAR